MRREPALRRRALLLASLLILWGCSREYEESRLQDRLLNASPKERGELFKKIHDEKSVRVLPSLIASGGFEDFARSSSVPTRIGMLQKLRNIPQDRDPKRLYDTLLDLSWDFGMMRDEDSQFEDVRKWLSDTDPRISFFAVAWVFDRRIPQGVGPTLALLQDAPEQRHPWLTTLCTLIRRTFSAEEVAAGIRSGDGWSIAVVSARRDAEFIPAIAVELEKATCPNAASLLTTLADIGDRKAVPPLLRELRQDPHQAFQPALRALVRLGDGSVVPALVELLGRSDDGKQLLLLDAIGDLGAEKDASTLEKYVVSGNARVSEKAQRAILKLKARRGSGG
jgi:hypothetical protein